MATQTFATPRALDFIEKMLASLSRNPQTRAQMESSLFASKSKMINYIKLLHTATETQPKRIYISRYEVTDDIGGRVPFYAVGNRPDAQTPGRRTNAERFAALKANPDRHRRHKALKRVNEMMQRRAKRPASPFAALGI